MKDLFVASVTPFTSESGGIDHSWIVRHLSWLAARGIDGVVPCGTTGEGPSLSFAERQAVIDTVMSNRGALRVIPGTGCNAMPETIALTRYAIERGAEAALVIPPFYFKNPSDAGMLAFYRAVCDALPSGGKIMLYHIPPISQIAISTGVIDGLLESHPQCIYGLKDSGGDADHTTMLIKRYPSIKIFTGSAPLLSRALGDGAAGGIFAIANILPQEMREIISAHAAGTSAEATQQRVAAISAAFKSYGAVASVKALLPYLTDLPAISVRAPLANLAESESASLWEQVRAL